MKFTPYPYQAVAIDHAEQFLRTAEMGAKQLYAAPTGCGKSVVELLLQQRMGDCYIVTPREEIVYGMLDKLGQLGADAEELGIWTPIRLRNRLMSGEVRHPKYNIFDETHHHEAESWQQIELLTGIAPCVGYTASPYRGTPKSTRAFRERWGEPLWLITYEEAIREGYITLPSFDILPLVDDDIIEVKGGEFDVTSLDGVTVDRLGDLADHAKQWYNGKWDKSTIFAFPSSVTCNQFQMECSKRGLPLATVTAKTPKAQRQGIFEAVEAGILALAHINVVSEGVDLKLRRLVDAAPTLSPVKWVQQLGRITRPTKDCMPEYICTNRNIMRHAYILEGIVPAAAIAKTDKVFGVSSRAHTRVLGLEALGRFKPLTAKLLSGGNVYVYLMSTLVNNIVVEYCAIVHPTIDPIWASKVTVRKDDGTKDWGTWVACEAPNDIKGFASKGAKEPSEKQAAWWAKSAARVGLDPDQELTRRTFSALPVLVDLGERLP